MSDSNNPTLMGGHAQYVKGQAEVQIVPSPINACAMLTVLIGSSGQRYRLIRLAKERRK